MKIVDTSVAIDHLRGNDRATAVLDALIEDGEDLCSSEIVRFELIAGVRAREADDLEAFFSALVWLPVTEVVARAGGDLARRYRRSHAAIDDADFLIAATAIVLGAEVLTTNVRHYPMFRGLKAPY